ncbi:MAG: hypothetical protein LBU53_02445 [Zoogloeaceae bacterium]|nr:hypothetical protein [Zoogloeaceae bacterium]
MLIIIGILPWSYYCFTTLFPRLAVTFGISSIRFGFLIALILVPPVLLFQVIRFLEWVFSDMDTSEY